MVVVVAVVVVVVVVVVAVVVVVVVIVVVVVVIGSMYISLSQHNGWHYCTNLIVCFYPTSLILKK
jgi:hypothetical protein